MSRIEIPTPTCLWCDRRLNPVYQEVKDYGSAKEWYKMKKHKVKILGYGYKRKGWFCSSGCGHSYAVNMLENNSVLARQRSKEIRESNAARGFNEDGSMFYTNLRKLAKQMILLDSVRTQDAELFRKMELAKNSKHEGGEV